MTDFRTIAAEILADIEAGRLQPGDRLPPQREFAYARQIAPSTAGRVYAELVRRGILAGEVGRGTFVRAPAAAPLPALAEPPMARIDMETNYPILPDQHRLMAPALAILASRADAFGASLRASSVTGSPAARTAFAAGLATPDWRPAAPSLLFAGNGRQGLAAAFAALVPHGERIGVEAMTYPVARSIAARLGMVAVPLAMDSEGVIPDAIEKAHRAAPLRAIYLQPTIHNPLGTTMSQQRRADIAALLERLDGPVIVEDMVYAFREAPAPPPLAAFAPSRVVVVDSLSKRIAPGLTLGMLSVPDPLVAKVARALVSGAWGPQEFSLDVGVRWLADGTVAALEVAKRADARIRQALASSILAGLETGGNPAAYHLMLRLPGAWRADAFVLAAARQGIAVTPSSAFAASAGEAPNAVRLALAAPTLDNLAASLQTLVAIAGSDATSAFLDHQAG
jgi:DNA-binding transcriptional MocR family regulator